MKKAIAKTMLAAVGYTKAPKATFLLRHPVKSASALLAWRAAKRAAPRTRAVAAATAAAVAVPVLWKTLKN